MQARRAPEREAADANTVWPLTRCRMQLDLYIRKLYVLMFGCNGQTG